MGKKQKEENSPNINAAANKDIIQRLSFLYQASVYLQSLDVSSLRGSGEEATKNLEGETLELDTRPKPHADKKANRKNTRTRQVSRRRTGDLARDYIHCLRQVAKKTTVKMCVNLYLGRRRY
jgi:ribonuclease P protein subunit RPR2